MNLKLKYTAQTSHHPLVIKDDIGLGGLNPSTSAYQRSMVAGNIKKGTHTRIDINMKHEIAANARKWKVPD